MARAVAVYRELHCHNCKATWKQHIWEYDEHWTQPREPLRCVNYPATCATPHIEVLPDWRRIGKFAQCRADQRCAVYFMPDGSVSAPPSNKFDDPVALAAVSQGGIRHEFVSVREMRQFQRDRRRSDNDDFTDRNLVIDYNQASILAQDHFIHQYGTRGEDEARERVYDRQRETSPIRVYFDGGARYEEAKRRSGRG